MVPATYMLPAESSAIALPPMPVAENTVCVPAPLSSTSHGWFALFATE